jgi:hypothetical protein
MRAMHIAGGDRESDCANGLKEPAVYQRQMFSCRHCSYQACAGCAVALVARLTPMVKAEGTIDVDRNDVAAQVGAADAVKDGMPCPLCKHTRGTWEHVPMPFFRWRCEGSAPRWRFRDRIIDREHAKDMSYDHQALQQHNEKRNAEQLRDQRLPVRLAWFEGVVAQYDAAENKGVAGQSMTPVPVSLSMSAVALSQQALASRSTTTGRQPHRRRRVTRRALAMQPSAFLSSSSSPSDDEGSSSGDGSTTTDEDDEAAKLLLTTGSRTSGKRPRDDAVDGVVSNHVSPPQPPPHLSRLSSGSGPGNLAAGRPPAEPTPTRPAVAPPAVLGLAAPDWHETSRGPCCPVGSAFVFAAANTGQAVNMMWFALVEASDSQRPGRGRRAGTSVPITGFVLPTTDAHSNLRMEKPVALRFTVDTKQLLAAHVSRFTVRALQLFVAAGVAEGNAAPGYSGFLPRSGVTEPLLTVSLLHPAAPLRELRTSTLDDNARAAIIARAAELVTVGRCVAFYGVGCKRALLEQLGDAVEMRQFAVHVLDPWLMGATPSGPAGGAHLSTIQRLCSAALDRIIANMIRYDEADAVHRRPAVSHGTSGPARASTTAAAGWGVGAFAAPPPAAVPTRQVSPPQPFSPVADEKPSFTQDAVPRQASLSIGPTQAPTAHVKLPPELRAALGGDAASAHRSGSGTSMYDLGERSFATISFSARCAQSRAARAVVHRAICGTMPKDRRASAQLLAATDPVEHDNQPLRHLVVVHNVDALDDTCLARLAQLYGANRRRVAVVCTFDNPVFLAQCAVSPTFGFSCIRVDTLVPYTRDKGTNAQHVTHEESFFAEAARHRRDGDDGAARRYTAASLPMRETIARSLLSVPAGFRKIVGHILQRQAEVGEDTFIGLNALMDYLAASAGSTSRVQAIVRELESNRIVKYEPTLHAMKVLQLSMVAEVLAEVNATAAGGGGALRKAAAAPATAGAPEAASKRVALTIESAENYEKRPSA